ncbi:unnamed protein product [Sphagnum jensenii]|uniref:DUF3987 domain-containing protein n=1 Tax=Sphagnum jensenii TaxID=128206 RepID=A0ABP0V7R9_9BRYO
MLEILKFRKQWVVRASDKIPRRVADGKPAATNNPNDWTTYSEAKKAIEGTDYGLGYVITDDDDLTCIDLDSHACTTEEQKQLHAQIATSFETYKEVSPSGNGLHIWTLGKLGSRKFSAQHVEIYDRARYMTITENPVEGGNLPIADCSHLLGQLLRYLDEENGNRHREQRQNSDITKETQTDEEIVETCLRSSIGGKFELLWEGRWKIYFETYHPTKADKSQSEADLALCNFVSFHTDSKTQCARIFLRSALAKRDKAARQDYIKSLVDKAFDQKYGDVVIDREKIEEKIRQIQIQSSEKDVAEESHLPAPPGLLGEVAEYIYSMSIKQSPEVALAASIAFLAGICGRAYNTATMSGLNQYIVLIATSAHGKEGAATGISRLLTCSEEFNSDAHIERYMGPSEIASAPAMLSFFKTSKGHPSLLTMRSEIGLWLQTLNSPYASPNDVKLKGLLLELYHKSGGFNTLNGTAYSDSQKNMEPVKSPAVTLLGDSTPEEFYRSIDEKNIREGLVSRFTLICAPNIRPGYNEYGAKKMPSMELLHKLTLLANQANAINAVGKFSPLVVHESPEANAYQKHYFQKIDDFCWYNRDHINAKIISRSHLKLLRLGALVAVGTNMYDPRVELEHYLWAEQIIEHGNYNLLTRFNAGDVGSTSFWHEQVKHISKYIKDYATGKIPLSKMMVEANITPSMYALRLFSTRWLQQKTDVSCFRNDASIANRINCGTYCSILWREDL